MPIGFFISRQSAPGYALRPLAAALCLVLTAPAQASWFGHKSDKKSQPTVTADASTATTISTLDATGTAANASIPSRPNDVPDAPGNSAADLSVAGSNPDAEVGNAAGDANAVDEADKGDDSVVLLPNVEESDLDDSDSPSGQYSPEELAALGNLWERIRKGFQMDSSVDNDRIAIQRNWYLKNEDYLERMARRASRYLYYTVSEAERRNLPTELALLPVIESAYDPFAYSHANAAGMWQFIPGTAKIMGVKQNEWFDGRRDIVESTRAAYDFLSLLYGKFGDWQLALAAYNAGPGAVQRAIERNQAAGLPTDFWSLQLPAETRAYVPRFLAVAQIVKSPESFGVELRPVLNQPFFRVVTTHGQVDMTQAASIAGVSLKEFYQLNAGFKRQATDPDGAARLLVPANLPEDYEADIAALPRPNAMVAQTYKVKKGDTLFRIAHHFDIQPARLKELNDLKSDKVPVGRSLTITRANVSTEFLALQKEMHLDRAAYAPAHQISARIYKVRRGDTLASIARRHGMNVKALARMNGLKPSSKVRTGQLIALQTRKIGGKQRLASVGRNKLHSRNDNSLRRIRYEVRHGDTLASIGRRYNVSVTQIKRWNRSSTLHPGQGLVLYVAGRSSRSM